MGAEDTDIPQTATDPYLAYSMGLSPESETVFPQPNPVQPTVRPGMRGQDVPLTPKKKYPPPMPDKEDIKIGIAMPAEDSDLAGDKDEEKENRIKEIEKAVEDLRRDIQIPNPYKDVFIFSTVATSGSAISWKEQCIVSGNYADFGPPRSGSLASGGWAKSIQDGAFVSVGQTGLMIQKEDPGNKEMAFRYVAGSSTITGLITSNAAGGGKYNGKSITITPGDVSASGDLDVSDLGTLSSTEDCLVLDMSEMGLADGGHYLTETVNTDQFAIYFEGWLLQTNSDGKKVVVIDKQWAGCGPDFYTGAAPSDFDGGIAVD